MKKYPFEDQDTSVMATILSKTQVDRLGDRLRWGRTSDADLRVLDEYRMSFAKATERVVDLLRNPLDLEPTTRPAKSTSSIVEKLRRETVRLSQMQDIAGCRVVVPDVQNQNRVVTALTDLVTVIALDDRRMNPSHGYRAVHVIAQVEDKPVEIQVRTEIEHRWADLAEKLADRFTVDIKYGGGPSHIQNRLAEVSSLVGAAEQAEMDLGNGPYAGQLPKELHGLREMVLKVIESTTKELES